MDPKCRRGVASFVIAFGLRPPLVRLVLRVVVVVVAGVEEDRDHRPCGHVASSAVPVVGDGRRLFLPPPTDGDTEDRTDKGVFSFKDDKDAMGGGGRFLGGRPRFRLTGCCCCCTGNVGSLLLCLRAAEVGDKGVVAKSSPCFR